MTKSRAQRPMPSRRTVIQGSGAASLLGFLGCRPAAGPQTPAGARAGLGFRPIPTSHADTVVVPSGYRFQVVSAWGDPVVAGAHVAFDPAADAAAQALAAGMGCDGMAYFPLPRGSEGANHGLLAVNYEYTDDGLLHPNGMDPWTADKAAKSRAAHGVGIVEVARDGGGWQVVQGSHYGRRITADTPIEILGPARGHPWMRTADDRKGQTVRGTFQNCACGKTPWGTYLTCEENVAPYFVNDAGAVPRLQQRYGVGPSKDAWGFRWEDFDPRFDAARYPTEPNRHGWVVEIDPYTPGSTPVKRTALGRMSHEGATVTLARDGRVVVYMGDDDFRSKFEHIYKFVSNRPYRPDSSSSEKWSLLDEGTLYAARFDPDGTGWWLPLRVGEPGLDAEHGFPTQAEVVIDARTAADIAGATYMDRPEWIAVHPKTGEVFCSLTNNSLRGAGKPFGAAVPLGADAANPRAPNSMGHIIRWAEQDQDAGATKFSWNIFLLAGDPALPDPLKRGNVRGAVAFSMPDGLVFDHRGMLWICTDASAKDMATAEWGNIGNNQLLAADPATGEVKRFLTGPVGCEITGVTFAAGGTTMFVNIQHPGEAPIPHPARNDPAQPKAHSSWPDGDAGTRPRSATIAISREDGGVIGA